MKMFNKLICLLSGCSGYRCGGDSIYKTEEINGKKMVTGRSYRCRKHGTTYFDKWDKPISREVL